MSTSDFIIALFCRVDQNLQAVPKHPQAHLYPSEIVTLALLFALKGVGPCAFYRWLSRNYADWFPALPERTRVFRLFETHVGWTEYFLAEPTVLGVADSYGIELRHPWHEDRADRQIGGKGRSNHRWIVGAKFAYIVNQYGRIVAWDYAAANVSDTAFHALIRDWTRAGDTQSGMLMPSDITFAEQEWQTFRQRGMQGRLQKASQGVPVGCGVAPYGYRYEGAHQLTRLVPDPVEAPVVQMIFRLYLTHGVRAILRWLHDNDIPCAAARGDRPAVAARRVRAPSVWSKASVYKILRNPVHIGQFRDHGSLIEVNPSIDTETWQAVQAKLDQGYAKSQPTKKTPYLFSRRIRCMCGYAAVGWRTVGDYRYYVCCAVSNVGEDTLRSCSLPRFRADAVESVAWNWLTSCLFDEEAVRESLARRTISAEQMRANTEAQLAHYYQDKLVIQRELNRFYERFGAGKLTAAELDELEAPRRSLLAQYDVQIAALRAQSAMDGPGAIDAVLTQLRTWKAQLTESDTFATRRALIDDLDVRAVIGIDDGGRFVELRIAVTEQMSRIRLPHPFSPR